MEILSEKDTTRVLDVIKRCVHHIPPDLLTPEDLADKPLTGNIIQCSAVDLVYILFEVEKEFGIRTPLEKLDQYQFSSFEKICAAVAGVLKEMRLERLNE